MPSPWRWDPLLVGWVSHTRSFTGWVAYERAPREPERPAVAAYRAAEATRFRVAIVGPECEAVRGLVERYWLRGSLAVVEGKLLAALDRRQRAHDARPPSPAVDALDWRADGPWYAPFHERSPDAPS